MGKKEWLWLLGIFVFVIIWMNFIKGKVMEVAASNFGLAILATIIVGYGFTLYFYHKESHSLKKTVGLFIMLFLVIGPLLSLRYTYTSEGIKPVSDGHRLEFDFQAGGWLEQNIFKCSSDTNLINSGLPTCSSTQTFWVFHFLNEGLVIIGVTILALVFRPRTAEAMIVNGGAS